jgi:hypothetical protein
MRTSTKVESSVAKFVFRNRNESQVAQVKNYRSGKVNPRPTMHRTVGSDAAKGTAIVQVAGNVVSTGK